MFLLFFPNRNVREYRNRERLHSDILLNGEPLLDKQSHNRIRIGNVRVDAIGRDELLSCLDDVVCSERQARVCFCEAHLCVQATFNEEIRRTMEGATLVLPDGVAVTAGARLLGQKFPERQPGPVIMLAVCEHGVNKGYRHFFYGGADGVADTLACRLQKRFPGIQIAGTYTPPFRPLNEAEEKEIKEKVEKNHTDILWVGLGAPKQELWMAEHAGKLDVPLMMGVGAAFDFHSGNRKWAPAWVRRAGLEWVYRMITGGPRVFFRNAKYESLFTCLIFRQSLQFHLKRLFASKK